jgi:ABC-2 type transport system permease protein
MRALNITGKDLLILLKEPGALFQLFVLPLIFIVVFSGALTAISAGEAEQDTRIPLAVVDLDGGEAAQRFVTDLEAAGGVRVEPHAQDEAEALLQERKLSRVLTIPARFGADLDAGRPVTLRLVNHPDADPEKTEATRLVIEGVAQDLALEYQILASLEQMAEMQANAPEASQVFTAERMIAQAQSQFERSRTQPLIDVAQRAPQIAERETDEFPDAVQLAVPAFTVMFVFLAAQTTAHSIYEEKRLGSFRRLLAAPMSKAALLAGKMLPNFVTALIQTAVIFAFGLVGLRLMGLQPLSLGNAPVGVILVAMAMALCSSGLGILIAALARTESQIGGLSTLILWGAGILGGSFVPLFILEQFLGTLPRFVPHYWANRAFENLLIRGLGLSSVIAELGALLAFTALFFAIGLWRFDFD